MALSKGEEEAPLLGDYLPLASQPLSSSPRTLANLVLCVVGVGILGLPYTFSNVGWLMGILTLLLGGTLCYHGMMLQIYSKHRLCKLTGKHDLDIRSYGDLTFHAFGPWGRLAVDVLLTLGTFSGAIAHIIFIRQNFVSIALDAQGTRIQGMQVPSLHSSSQMVFSHTVVPCAGVLNSTSDYNMSSIKVDDPFQNSDVHNSSRMLQESYTSAGFIHANQSFFELNSLPELIHQVGNISLGSLLRHCLARINWSSSTTYTWFMFPLIVALCAIPSITSLAPLSTLGNLVSFSALAAIMISDVLEIKTTPCPQIVKAFGDMVAVPSAFGVGIYSFQASGIVIPLEASMVQPLKFGSVMRLAFSLIAVLYATSAVLGYAAFGPTTQQVITLNLRVGIEAMLIKVAFSFSVFLVFPLMFAPMFELAERRFSRRKLSLGLRTLLVFVICLLSTEVKQFADFLSLTGSSISCLLGFILPAAVHIKVMNEDDGKPTTFLPYIADYLLILFGLIFGACGTIVSFHKFL